MTIAFDNIKGLDRERVLAAVESILRAHHVEGVEVLWRTDRGAWVLEVNVEIPGSKIPGEGITIDLCAEISRDLSAALDVADAIPAKYQLQVGSPGLDRALYRIEDYGRFRGQLAKVRLREPLPDGRRTIEATIQGLREDPEAQCQRVVLETDAGELSLDFSQIEGSRLVFDWNRGAGPHTQRPKKKPGRKGGRGATPRGSQQSR